MKHRKFSTYRTLAAIICILLLLPGYSQAATDKGLDIVLVLDSSGSMKKNDPKRMRVEAARMFVTLLDQTDRVAIVSFSGKATSREGMLSLKSYHNEQALLRAIETVSAKGNYTNIHEALRKGFQLLKRSKRKEKLIVLMSDGKMDVGKHEKNLQLLERTLEELTPALAKKDIKVYSIAFTENSYIPLLKLAAKDTNGHFTLLKNANGIHQVFENIFERSKNPDMLPMQEDSFIVDKSVNELTIVASKYRPESRIFLENPSGEDFTDETEAEHIKWYSAKKFDLITISNPEPGYWNIKFSEGGNKAYVLTNLGLNVEVSKTQVQPGNPFELQAWLEKNGKKVNKRQLLNATKFKATITYPDGREDSVNLTDDGSEIGSARHDGKYGNTFVFTDEGLHKLEVFTQGETFDRQKSVFITVKAIGNNNPFAVMDKPKTPPPAPEPVAEETPPVEQVTTPAPGIQPDEPKTDTNKPTEHTIVEEGKTETLIEPVVEEKPQTEEIDEHADDDKNEEEKDIDVTSAIIAFVLFNIAIGGGIALWMFIKRQKKKKQEAESDTEEAIDLSDGGEDATDSGEAADDGGGEDDGGEASNPENI